MAAEDLYDLYEDGAGVYKGPDRSPGMARIVPFDVLPKAEIVRDEEPFVFDIECYPNYFCIYFLGVKSRKVHKWDGGSQKYLRKILTNCRLIGFNSDRYDVPMAQLACSPTITLTTELHEASKRLIAGDRIADVLKGVDAPEVNSIDISRVAPLFGSLKTYAARLHCEHLQDLPYPPDTVLDRHQRHSVRLYCQNDCRCTLDLYMALRGAIRLRRSIGDEYGIDVRSKSDAQIAEAIMGKELERAGVAAKAGKFDRFRYRPPAAAKFVSEELRDMKRALAEIEFEVGPSGSAKMPDELKGRAVRIGKTDYMLGIGGLHSTEKCVTHYADAGHMLAHIDVSSYYPMIILTQRLAPRHLDTGKFLQVYGSLVARRLDAKKRGDKTTADALKIAVNGVYGKTMSKYSELLYSPDVGPAVSLTGQLLLLMLIERMELAGVRVVSANTDGLVVRSPLGADVAGVMERWQADTGMTLDRTDLASLHSRDVNNYVAVTYGGEGVMTKGVFAAPMLAKNPAYRIVYEAVVYYLRYGHDIAATVDACDDITRFVASREVKGGAVWNGSHIGKVVRWYIARSGGAPIVYAQNGNRVPLTDAAKPVMTLPDSVPDDLYREWYIAEAGRVLQSVGMGAGRREQPDMF